MAGRDEIVKFINEYLSAGTIKDYCTNGLQVEGSEEITRIVSGVSCSLELFEEAAVRGAQMILVHHGLIWNVFPGVITGILKKRLKSLLDNDINLVAYHLPLDSHQEIGHSAMIARGIGLENLKPFGAYNGGFIGVSGTSPSPVSLVKLSEMVTALCGRKTMVLGSKKDFVSNVAIVSGGGGDMASQAVDAGMDVFISGEAKEHTQAFCQETGLTFIEAGHYHSEKPGVIALGELLSEKFNIPVEFFDIPNPV
jgi:dinuclear metal center YbgI/SA1388 family protein